MIERRALLVGAAGILAVPSIASPAPLSKPYRIGILEARPASDNGGNLAAFRLGLEERGYVERRDYVIEYRSADGRPERFAIMAAELVRIPVDVILAAGTVAVLAAKRATTTIPIVMTSSGDPIGAGAVGSLPYPGANVTGVSALVAEVSGKRIQLLKEAVPAAQRIAMLLDMSNPAASTQWVATKAAAASMKLVPFVLDVRRPEDLRGAFERAARDGAEAMMVGRGAVSLNHAREITDLALRYRLPTMFPSRDFVEVGGLMAYGVNYADLYRHSAKFVDKIFKGAKAGDLPVEEPTNFELTINLTTANKLRITIPASVLSRADRLIE
ncbi:MAG TPA: ABC transporter substrate-binding protein [Methylomirabilota bacterium]|nr:ABC transporter substrate-binding protein [Methylomirabilota bacterium]